MYVSTVLPALQVKTMEGDSLSAFVSEKIAKVTAASMAVLKVNTTAAPGETPTAPLFGIADIIVGCAIVQTGMASSISGTISAENNRVFIKIGNVIPPGYRGDMGDSFMASA